MNSPVYPSNYFKALSDDTRLRLINLLIHHELSVNETVALLEMGQSRVSRHLKVLTGSGLLRQRRDGLWAFYSAVTKGPGRDFLDSLESFFESDPALSADLKRMNEKIEDRTREKIKYFDSIAPRWSSIRGNIFGGAPTEKIIEEFLEPAEVTADIGCGTGEFIPLLKKFSKKIIGIDRSRRMLEIAGSRHGENKDSVELRLGEAEHLPMRDNEADMALMSMVMHYMPAPEEAIYEAGRAIKKDGVLILLDLLKHNNEEMRIQFNHRWLGFDVPAIENRISEAEFKIESKKEFSLNEDLSAFLIKCRKQ